MVSNHHFEIDGQPIGNGAFGSIRRAIFNQKHVAFKIFLSNDEQGEREVKLLMTLRHENIVQINAQVMKGTELAGYIMELSENGSLYDLIHLRPYIQYDMRHVIDWMWQCSSGVLYLHEQHPPILHRDLKPQNMLLSDNYTRLKLCDFGTATGIEQSRRTGEIGTCVYMAPEVFNGEGKYDETCDVYSFAISFWELIARKKPYWWLSNYAIMNWVNSLKRLPLFNNMPKIMELFIRRMWDHDRTQRPNIRSINEFFHFLKKYKTSPPIVKNRRIERNIKRNTTTQNKSDVRKLLAHSSSFCLKDSPTSENPEVTSLSNINYNNLKSFRLISYEDNKKYRLVTENEDSIDSITFNNENLSTNDIFSISNNDRRRTSSKISRKQKKSFDKKLCKKILSHYSFLNDQNGELTGNTIVPTNVVCQQLRQSDRSSINLDMSNLLSIPPRQDSHMSHSHISMDVRSKKKLGHKRCISDTENIKNESFDFLNSNNKGLLTNENFREDHKKLFKIPQLANIVKEFDALSRTRDQLKQILQTKMNEKEKLDKMSENKLKIEYQCSMLKAKISHLEETREETMNAYGIK
ncbi:hypothetical protein SNEBB_000420 [Seison nebaliae]|nr:hypothetical protein SNEBB_000420 [Seison nebaliae]